MAQSVLDRLQAAGYVALSAEIDPEAAEAAGAAEPVTDEVAAERVAVAEEAVADADIAIEIRGDLDEAESIVIEIRKDDEIGESLAGASEELTETVLTTESYMKEGGMTAQTAQEHLRNLKRLGAVVGFKINPALPSFESFGGISSRLDATGLVMQEEQNWLKKVWETIKGWLKTAYDNVMKFFERIFTAAGRLEARAQGIADNILKRKQHAKAESVKASAATVKLIGSGDIKGAAAGVRETYQKAFAASLERAMRFNGAVVASLKTGGKEKVAAPAIADVSYAGWKFKSEGDKVSWEHEGEAKEADIKVASREDIKAAALEIVALAKSIKGAKENGGKNAQAYKDSVAAGEAFAAKVKSAGGASGADGKAAMTARLNSLKDARQAFTQPGVAVTQWGTSAGNAVLDVLAKMSRAYTDNAAESSARADKAAKKEEGKKEGEKKEGEAAAA